MENPDTWGPAEHAVRKVLDENFANQLKPPSERMIGMSLERRITEALREAGLLRDTPDS